MRLSVFFVFPSFPIKMHATDEKTKKIEPDPKKISHTKVSEAVCKRDWHNVRSYLFFSVQRPLSWMFPGGHRVCPCNGFSVNHFGLISCVWPCGFTHLQLQTAVAVEADCLTHPQAQLGSGLSSARLVPRPRHTRSISVWNLRGCLRLWRSERAARPHQVHIPHLPGCCPVMDSPICWDKKHTVEFHGAQWRSWFWSYQRHNAH